MTIDTLILHAQLAHAVKLILEALLCAGGLTFAYFVAPAGRR